WVGFVGRLLATFWPAHDDRVSRGSPAEYFEIPYLVTHYSRERWAWRLLIFRSAAQRVFRFPFRKASVSQDDSARIAERKSGDWLHLPNRGEVGLQRGEVEADRRSGPPVR